jgi:hypothetical protein
MNLDVLFHFAREGFRRCNLLSDLHRVRCPTLVLGGGRDPICPIEDQADIVAALPSGLARFARFDACGHGVFRDDPEGAAKVIRDFIQTPLRALPYRTDFGPHPLGALEELIDNGIQSPIALPDIEVDRTALNAPERAGSANFVL